MLEFNGTSKTEDADGSLSSHEGIDLSPLQVCSKKNKARKTVAVESFIASARLSELSAVETRLYNRFIEPVTTPSSPWVLCNISKHLYVFEETAKDVGLGGFLTSQICWSPDTATTRRWDGSMEKGAWVGDRFEITTLDRLRGGADKWRNVGEELLAEFEAIWRSEWMHRNV
jgi:hypothetical protein